MTNEEFANLVKDVQEAQKLYENLQDHARNASREATSALNRLNQAQKDFDKALDAIRGEAPSDSDWQRKLRDREQIYANTAIA